MLDSSSVDTSSLHHVLVVRQLACLRSTVKRGHLLFRESPHVYLEASNNAAHGYLARHMHSDEGPERDHHYQARQYFAKE